jgi:2-polyprenyl-3-methyl-5-hydroxy-6-metoxy-1,4-benzoquinol methylase
MFDLSRRNLLPEWMDDPQLDAAMHHQALTGLARLNFIGRSAEMLWPYVHRFARASNSRALRVLDIGSGAGDVVIALWKKARRQGISMEIVGLDISPTAVDVARHRAESAGARASFEVCDVLAETLPSGFDVVMSSLFLHHLDDGQARQLLKQMRQSTEGLLLINDLERSRVNLWQTQLAARVLTRSPVVHVDAPRSIERAFSLAEVRSLAEAAGLRGHDIRRHWPCRFVLSWRAD